MSLTGDYLQSVTRSKAAQQNEKNTLLNDPAKLDKYVGGITQQLSTDKRIAKKGKAASIVDRVDLKIADSSPMKGAGREIQNALTQELMNPANSKYSIAQITSGITKAYLTQADKTGKSRLQKAYEDHRVKESSRAFVPLFSGANPNDKAPSPVAGLMDYKSWKAKTRGYEDKKMTGEHTATGYLNSLSTAGKLGFGIGATAALIAGQLGPQALVPEEIATVPIAGTIGGIATMAGEAIAYPWREIVEKSEWGRSRKAKGGIANTVTTGAVKLVPDLVVGAGLEVMMLKSVQKVAMITGKAIANPDTPNFIAAVEAQKKLDKAAIKMTEPYTKKYAPGDPDTPIAAAMKTLMKTAEYGKINLGTGEMQYTAKKLVDLPPAARLQAAADPEGLIKGAQKEAEKVEAIRYTLKEDKVITPIVGTKPVVKTKPTKKVIQRKKAEKQLVEDTGKALDNAAVVEGKSGISGKLVPDTVPTATTDTVITTTKKGKEVATLAGSRTRAEKLATLNEAKLATDITDKELGVVESAWDTGSEVTETFIKETADDLGKYAYIPVKKGDIDTLMQQGIMPGTKGTTLQGSEEAAKKTKAGGLTVRVRKDRVPTTAGRGKDTLKTQSNLTPADFEVKTDNGWMNFEKYKKYKELKPQYTEIENKLDDFVIKYHPEVGKLKGTEKLEALNKYTQATYKKMSTVEHAELDGMVKKYQDAEAVVSGIPKVIQPIKSEELMSSMREVVEGTRAGSISATQAAKQTEELIIRANSSGAFNTPEGADIRGAMYEAIAGWSKKGSMLGILAAMGITGSIIEAFSPAEAEAANWGGIAKGVSSTLKTLTESSLNARKITSDNVFHMTDNVFQQGFGNGAKEFMKEINTTVRATQKSGLRGIKSPQSQFYEILKQGKNKMVNPAVFKVSYYLSEANNVKNGLKVFSNIYKNSGVVTAKKEVTEMFKPLRELTEKQYMYDYHVDKVDEIAANLKSLTDPDIDTVKYMKQQIAISKHYVDKLKPDVGLYHKEWAATAEAAAKKHSSARVFFAADDSAEFSKYVFMKGINLSEAEKLAVGRVKRQLSTYKKRMIKNKMPVMDGAYMHYSMHPSIKLDKIGAGFADPMSMPYMKNYARSTNARPMVPDAIESMSRYVPDVEKRLQTQQFWETDGWGKVAAATRHIPSMHQAFEALKKGSNPVANSLSNNVARAYTSTEVFKRLFLSPSAGLKHIMKITADMATVGVKETVSSIPSAVNTVGWRMVEDTPFLQNVVSKAGLKPSATTKLKVQMLNSIAPAYDTRYRMMQMGYGGYDTYFEKFQAVAERVNNVGGSFINVAELVDRAVTMEVGLSMAAKKGLTQDQAMYGIYDTLLKNNFLGREFTPQWLKNPKTQALLMFQTTPYKIMERRSTMALRTGNAIKDMGKEVWQATRTLEGRTKFNTDLKNIWKDMKGTEAELKANLILDPLTRDTDFYGNAVVKQFAKDLLIIGSGIGVAGSAGLDLHAHLFHLPFITNSRYSGEDFSLAVSPAVSAVAKGHAAYTRKNIENEDTILLGEIMQKWMGKSGVFPDTVKKMNRISNYDIPDIYNDSRFQYFLGIPGKEGM